MKTPWDYHGSTTEAQCFHGGTMGSPWKHNAFMVTPWDDHAINKKPLEQYHGSTVPHFNVGITGFYLQAAWE